MRESVELGRKAHQELLWRARVNLKPYIAAIHNHPRETNPQRALKQTFVYPENLALRC